MEPMGGVLCHAASQRVYGSDAWGYASFCSVPGTIGSKVECFKAFWSRSLSRTFFAFFLFKGPPY